MSKGGSPSSGRKSTAWPRLCFQSTGGLIDYVAEAPGIDEEFLLDCILELFEKHSYDKIVWDTSPAGLTLRLLQCPEIFASHLDVVGRRYYRIAVQYQKIKEDVL